METLSVWWLEPKQFAVITLWRVWTRHLSAEPWLVGLVSWCIHRHCETMSWGGDRAIAVWFSIGAQLRGKERVLNCTICQLWYGINPSNLLCCYPVTSAGGSSRRPPLLSYREFMVLWKNKLRNWIRLQWFQKIYFIKPIQRGFMVAGM